MGGCALHTVRCQLHEHCGKDRGGRDSSFIYFTFFSETDAQNVFGWASITADINNDLTTKVTINEWAYETSGGAIHVPDTVTTPEPTTSGLALLGLGAAGVAAWRRRKQRPRDGQSRAV